MALFLKRYKNGGNGGGAEPFGRTMHRNAGGTGDTEEKPCRCGSRARKRRNLLIMKLFYLLPYDGEQDFYEQFEKRMQMAERSLR